MTHTRIASDRDTSHGPTLPSWVLFPLVAAAVVALSFDGAASIERTSLAAILAWWTVIVALATGVLPRERPPRAALVAGALLAAFALLSLASVLWAASAERAGTELGRVSLYLALFCLTAFAVRRSGAVACADGMAAGIAIVGALALAQRLIPGFASDGGLGAELAGAAVRLSYPIGYWNGLGAFLALGVPLLLRSAVTAETALRRGVSIAPVPALAVAIYLTSSRGGAAVALVCCVVFVLLAAPRLRAILTLAVAVAGAGACIAIVSATPELVDGPLGSAAAREGGPPAALGIAVACLATAIALIVVRAVVPSRLSLAPLASRAAVVALVALAVGAVLLADPAARLEAFKAPPASTGDPDFVRSHLLSGGGSGRWQFWQAAVEQFEAHPLIGDGAGSFEAWWARHGELVYFVRNAHSLWLETLGELGLVGLLLLVGAFVVVLASAAVRIRRATEQDRMLLAALAAVVAGFMVGAGLDWLWQIPAVGAVAVSSLGLLAGATTDGAVRAGRSRAPLRAAAVGTAVLAAAVVFAGHVAVWLGDVELRASRDAVAQGRDDVALERAASARALQPWAATPRLQIALVQEEAGDLGRARASTRDAIDHDPADWRLRVVAARLATKDGAIADARRALDAARELSPRSSLLGSAAAR